MFVSAQQGGLCTCLWDPQNITRTLSGDIRLSVMYGSQPENCETTADRPDCLRLPHITVTVEEPTHTNAHDKLCICLLFLDLAKVTTGARCKLFCFVFHLNVAQILQIKFTQDSWNTAAVLRNNCSQFSTCKSDCIRAEGQRNYCCLEVQRLCDSRCEIA